MARVLITRAQPQADSTAARVAALGHDVIIAPLTQIQPQAEELARIGGQQLDPLVLVTSARALDVLVAAGMESWIAARAFAVVGERAAALVNSNGGHLAMPPCDTVANLVAAVSNHYGAMLYLAGAERRAVLEQAYPSMQVVEVYQAIKTDGFGAHMVRGLASAPPTHGLVYSPRSAAILAGAVQQSRLEEHLANTQWLCLSDDVEAALRQALPTTGHCKTAARPNEEALLDLLP